MQYLGGKSRLAKKFAPILIEALDRRGGKLYEPFVGGFNVVPALGDAVKEAHCSDVHPGLITLYRNLQIGWDPPENLSEEEYKRLRERCDWSNPLTAFAAFGCSFGGKEWGGYARNATGQNYAKASKNSLIKKKEKANRCEFSCSSYTDVEPRNSVVYCDPPYVGTTKYKAGNFDHDAFYDWCEKISKDNDVFVSEFTASDHWEVVWELERKVTMRRDSKYQTKIDRLYKV